MDVTVVQGNLRALVCSIQAFFKRNWVPGTMFLPTNYDGTAA